ncbi:hypothetical protein [Mesorhizobium sp. B2-3-12]|uniref:hypothetical protein n=1 Tax=Mesorhizobium sp. B2-3-12 TaxID=2589952 RepID=UPI0032B26658
MKQTYGPTLFAEAAGSIGLHPFPCPSANMSQAYTNPLGVSLAPCTYCGFCEKFGCGNFGLRTESEVTAINLDSSRKHATGVTYVDMHGNEYEQPADPAT